MRDKSFYKKNYKMQNFKTKNRNDEDREINHHGRPVEVGEDESRPGSTNKVGHTILSICSGIGMVFYTKCLFNLYT